MIETTKNSKLHLPCCIRQILLGHVAGAPAAMECGCSMPEPSRHQTFIRIHLIPSRIRNTRSSW